MAGALRSRCAAEVRRRGVLGPRVLGAGRPSARGHHRSRAPDRHRAGSGRRNLHGPGFCARTSASPPGTARRRRRSDRPPPLRCPSPGPPNESTTPSSDMKPVQTESRIVLPPHDRASCWVHAEAQPQILSWTETNTGSRTRAVTAHGAATCPATTQCDLAGRLDRSSADPRRKPRTAAEPSPPTASEQDRPKTPLAGGQGAGALDQAADVRRRPPQRRYFAARNVRSSQYARCGTACSDATALRARRGRRSRRPGPGSYRSGASPPANEGWWLL